MPESKYADRPDCKIFVDNEADHILTSVRALRRGVVEAWQSRSVLLTREEQRQLRDEIRDTCALLTDLTSGA